MPQRRFLRPRSRVPLSHPREDIIPHPPVGPQPPFKSLRLTVSFVFLSSVLSLSLSPFFYLPLSRAAFTPTILFVARRFLRFAHPALLTPTMSSLVPRVSRSTVRFMYVYVYSVREEWVSATRRDAKKAMLKDRLRGSTSANPRRRFENFRADTSRADTMPRREQNDYLLCVIVQERGS